MRIGIEAQRLFRKKKHGMDIVALELIKALQEMDTVNEYFLFIKADEDADCLPQRANFKVVILPNAPYPWWEQIMLRREIKKYDLDLLHCTSNTAPERSPVSLVVTVHDIIYLEKINLFKGSAYQIFGNLYRRWNVPRIIKKAVSIITVSEFEKGVIQTKFPTVPIHAVYNGVSETFQRIKDVGTLQQIKTHYNLPEKFIFFMGNTDPKKNLIGVLKAYSLLLKKNPTAPKLVMLDLDRRYLTAMLKKIGNSELINSIVLTGYIPNFKLPALYSLATIFLYPSLRESFGMPVLEAMACGVPLITSTTSSMPEIARDAAILVNPEQPEEMAIEIERLLENDQLRSDLIRKGYERVSLFRWSENARKTLQLYQQIHARTQNRHRN